MNTLYQYIQSGRVIKSYRNKLDLIKNENEYQHFLARMSNIETTNIPSDLFDGKIKELEKLLSMTPEQAFELAIKEDSNGYLDDLKEKNDPNIKKYLWVCRIIDNYNILRRNNQVIPGELKQTVYVLLDEKMIDFMCNTSKNEFLRSHEGTLCVNGIGYLLYLWGDDTMTKIKEAFIDLYRYYLEKVDREGLYNRNFVYGLTHCVIDISDFYTKDVNEQIMMFQKTYPIGELYDQTTWEIGHNLSIYTKLGSTLTLDTLSSDMLAELLVVYKLLLDDYLSNKWYSFGYTISRVYNELVNRIDLIKGYIRDHKEENLALDLKKNEHTNILFILYSRL